MHKFVSLLFFLVVIVACSNSESNSSDSVDPSEILIIDFIEDADTSATDSSEIAATDTTEADTITKDTVQAVNGMVFVKGGTINIGTNDKSFKANERPSMKVVLKYDFYMGVHEVTCGDYGKVAKETKLKTFKNCSNDSLPITDITYYDVVLFANAKSKLEGYDTAYTYSKAVFDGEGHCTYLEGISFHADAKAFRLPTEAEWIYAATRAWDTGKSWNNSNSGYKLHTVCSKDTNAAGFCDMAGNAMEWVNDWMGAFRDTTITNYVGAPDGGNMGERVVKGGCYTSSEKELNPYSRGDVYTVTSSTRAEYVGFRLAFGNIPNALWMGDNGISQTSIVTPLAGNETVKGITGSYNTKLAFRNDVSGNIAIIDYLNGISSVKEITKGIDAYHPEISPNGKWIAYCTGFEGVSSKSTVYVQSLEEKSTIPIKLDVEKAVIPRWRILETGDTAIVFVTDAGNNKDEASFKAASTWQVTFAGGKFGKPQKLFDGAYHGGISEDNSLAVTGARLLRARMDERDIVWYNGEQACNVSLAMDRSKRTAFLDFGGQTGKNFVGSNYNTHQRILIADSTGKLIQSIQAPSGYTFDHTEWTTDNTRTNIVATLTNMNGAHTKIVLVNPLDSSVTELAEGEELWHPNLWVKKKAVKRSSSSSANSSSSAIFSSSSTETSSSSSSEREICSSSEIIISSNSEDVISSSSETITPLDPNFELDLDSAGIYYTTTGGSSSAIFWRYKMEFIWQYKDIANTIVLGSSRAYDAINPLLITPPFYAINLAVHGNTIGGDYKILTNYILPHIKEAKVIITSIDIDRWNIVQASFFESDYKSYPGYIYDQNHNYWKGGYPDGLAEATYDSPGETGQSDVNRPTRGFAAQKNHGWGEPSIGQDSTWINKFSNEFDKNFNVLVEMIELCLQKNIILIGVITPQNPRYKETGAFGNGGLLRSQAPELIKQITDLNSLYPNFILMDENKMGNHDYTDDMAFDSSHLSRKGAEQLTSRLDSLIQTLDIDFTP
jgi:uncharacterized protein (TIGR02171 family)